MHESRKAGVHHYTNMGSHYPDVAQNITAIHARHLYVQKQDVDRARLSHFESGPSVLDSRDYD